MFVDSLILSVASGDGGTGKVSFRKEKFVPQGGPDGGDGGKGGDVYFLVDKNTDTLSHLKGKKFLKAQNGEPGSNRQKSGKDGDDLIIHVPPGTQVFDNISGQLLLDLVNDKEKVLFLEGGKGGLGNVHFKTPTNQAPTYAQPGLPGVKKEIRLELKLIADVGLVGFPNVGKSTLISSISNAHPEVANYEFTTLTPHLGVVAVDEFSSFVMADIPGIIDGASEGRGLGFEFLKHIERTKTLLFMIDLANYRDEKTQFKTLKKELQKFSVTLASKTYAIALTRTDALDKESAISKIEAFLKAFKFKKSSDSIFGFSKEYPFFEQSLDNFNPKKPLFIAPISSVSKLNIKPLIFALYKMVKRS